MGLRIIPRVWTFSRDLHNHECYALQNGFSKCMMKPVLMPRKDHKGARQPSWKTWVFQAQIWRWEIYSRTLQPWGPTSMLQTREEAQMHSLSWAPEQCLSLQEGYTPSYNAFSSGQMAQTDAPWRAPIHWKRHTGLPYFFWVPTERGKLNSLHLKLWMKVNSLIQRICIQMQLTAQRCSLAWQTWCKSLNLSAPQFLKVENWT